MIRKIIFTNYFSEFIHQVPIKFRFSKALQKKCFQSGIIFRHYVKMPPIKFRERLTKFMIFISLSEKFCCQNLITSIKVTNMTRNSSKSNKLRNINTIGCRTFQPRYWISLFEGNKLVNTCFTFNINPALYSNSRGNAFKHQN